MIRRLRRRLARRHHLAERREALLAVAFITRLVADPKSAEKIREVGATFSESLKVAAKLPKRPDL